ncbi:MAG: DNA polymerase III subunit delta' [Desulfovibrio sp.]|nr:DNA polymerase III subunit delta' [Desulfovibrio sp.]
MTELEPIERRLDALSYSPPGVLLLEGGSEENRLRIATRWARALNCRGKKDFAPCGECAVCRQIEAREYLDVLYFDGRISNKDDDENPGVFAALRIENIRKVKAALGVKPHGDGKRVVIIQGMGTTREEALNTMLKTLEEPGEFTNFVLLTPQRGQILPTLVSRSFCVTLPWESSASASSEAGRRREDELGEFIERGSAGYLDKLAAKGQTDVQSATEMLAACQRALVRATIKAPVGALDRSLAKIANNPERIALCARWLIEAQEMIALGVTPVRALEAMATKFFSLRSS